jgi:hypothetical protein
VRARYVADVGDGLAAAETWAAQAVIKKRLDTRAASRLDALAAARARPWWRRLAG